MKRLLIFLIFIPYIVFCSGTEETNPDEPVYTEAGKEFEIVISSNPSTGYHWVILEQPDSTVTEFITEEYEPDSRGMRACGSGGKSIFIFKANKPGETEVSLGYFGPYDNHLTDEPAFVAVFMIIVEE
jgi:inhibitor of cysteine peptidase